MSRTWFSELQEDSHRTPRWKKLEYFSVWHLLCVCLLQNIYLYSFNSFYLNFWLYELLIIRSNFRKNLILGIKSKSFLMRTVVFHKASWNRYESINFCFLNWNLFFKVVCKVVQGRRSSLNICEKHKQVWWFDVPFKNIFRFRWLISLVQILWIWIKLSRIATLQGRPRLKMTRVLS